MKVLIVNSSDVEGGAARAAHRLHRALCLVGVSSRMLVQSKNGGDRLVEGPATPMAKLVSKMRPGLDLWPVGRYPGASDDLFSPAWLPFSGIVGRINASDADVVHLHWVAAGMLRIEELAQVRKPIVWSLHDMWPFSGGCHYDKGCGRHTGRCGRCPMLGSGKERDLSRRVFQRKARTYAGIKDLTIVGVSRWLGETATASTLLKDKRTVFLPNPIDTDVFKPVDKRVAKRILGLPEDKPLVLFGAVNATADPRKGFVHLSKALRSLPPGSLELAVFGSDTPEDPPDLGHPAHYLGRMHDDTSLCVLYNAADVTVVPSVQENLSNTIVESLACGTPAVGFAIGGNGDMVVDGINGRLAVPFDPLDLAACIRWVLEHPAPGELSANARRTAMERFGMRTVGERYRALYEDILGRKGG